MSERHRFSFAVFGALVVFAAAYSNSLRNAFHFDDVHVVETNLFIRDLANVPRFFTDATTFTSLPQNAVYRPLVSTSLAIDYAIGRGLDRGVFHTTQLILFASLGALLFLLYRKLFDSAGESSSNRWVALFAATLYCVHTGNTQAGNYISARSELLSALGVVGSFVAYLYAPRSRRFHLYLIPAAIGLFAKNHAVMFAPLLLAYKLLIEHQLSFRQLFSRRDWPSVKSALLTSAPAFVLLGALVVFVESMGTAAQSYGGGGRLAYLATQAWVWVRYASLYFVPAGLSADTDLHPFAGFDPRTLVGIALLGVSLAAAWRASRSSELRPVAFGILWFWIAIAPTSSIFPLAEVTNDHRMFIGFAGLNLAVVWSATVLVRRTASASPGRAPRIMKGAVAVGGLVLAVHAVSTFQRNKVWRDDETLWADVARKSPRNGRGLMNYGLSQMRRGRLVEARDLFLRAKQFNPYYSFLEANLGIVYNALGDSVTAERHFKQAAALDPMQPVVHRHYGYWLVNHGRGPEGMSHIQVLVVLASADIEARRWLMGLYAAIGAEAALRRLALETNRLASWDPDARAYVNGSIPLAPATRDAKGWFDLGWSLTQSNRHVDAAQAYRAALGADPRNADAWNNLGWTLGKLGFYDGAVAPLEKALALRPSYQLAKNNLAWVRAEAAKGRAR